MASCPSEKRDFKSLLSNASNPAAVSQQKKLVDLIYVMTEDEECQYQLQRVAGLLKAGVDPFLTDYLKEVRRQWGPPEDYLPFLSPIHYAIEQDLPELLELLLVHGGDPNERCNWGGRLLTPVHVAAGFGSKKCLQKLIELRADILIKTEHSRTLTRSFECTERQRQWAWRTVLGSTPLHLAITGKHTECITLLMDAGVDFGATDDIGQTTLYLAAKQQLPEVVMAHLDRIKDNDIVNTPTNKNDTVLHECLRQGETTECIKRLIECGADISIHCHDDCPVHKDVWRCHRELTNLFISWGQNNFNQDFEPDRAYLRSGERGTGNYSIYLADRRRQYMVQAVIKAVNPKKMAEKVKQNKKEAEERTAKQGAKKSGSRRSAKSKQKKKEKRRNRKTKKEVRQADDSEEEERIDTDEEEGNRDEEGAFDKDRKKSDSGGDSEDRTAESDSSLMNNRFWILFEDES